MLRTNLATRPFYDVRRIRALLALGALLVAAFTVFNAWEIFTLTRRDASLGSSIRQADAAAASMRQEAARARAGIDRERLEAVLEASREANALIERRVFSWTGLLNELERTIPAGVRIRSIRPAGSGEGLRLDLVVVARSAEDVETFVESLQGTGTFRDVFTRSENAQDDGTLEVLLEGLYMPPAPAPPAPVPEAAQAGGQE